MSSSVVEWLEGHLRHWCERNPGEAEPCMFTALRTVAAEADNEEDAEQRAALREAVEDVLYSSVLGDHPDIEYSQTPLCRLPDAEQRQWWLDTLASLQANAPADDPIRRYTKDDLLAEIAQGNHRCSDGWVRVLRMALALTQSDDDAFRLVLHELGACAHCLRAVAELAAEVFGRYFALREGDEAAELIADELTRVLM